MTYAAIAIILITIGGFFWALKRHFSTDAFDKLQKDTNAELAKTAIETREKEAYVDQQADADKEYLVKNFASWPDDGNIQLPETRNLSTPPSPKPLVH